MSWPVIVFGMVLPWLLLLFACWLGLQVLRQTGRILLRLEMVEQYLAQGTEGAGAAAPEGLPTGIQAPEFTLPDLAGQPHSLAEYLGKQVLLVFFNPQCGYCVQMAPDLAALSPDGGDGRPVPVLVTTGSVEANRALLDKHGVRCRVLLQKETELAGLYKADGTPVGYRIDEQGRIASELATGAAEVLRLAKPTPATPAPGCNGHGAAPTRGKANRGLHTSRIPRDGLKAGTPAPDFTLPRLDGGELQLSAYRGRRVLLVFSDPECGPCMELAPRLERLHRQRPDLPLLLVSRREPEANRAKVREHGLTFPVVLQKGWEVSRLYAMFATPIGYLIDEQGVIAKDVAAGVEAILDLVREGQLAAG